jgi:GLPGLI family protein
MKKHLLYLLLAFTCQIFAQNYKITYSFSVNIDADTIKNQDKKYFYKNHYAKELDKTFGVLYTNIEGAIFEQEGTMQNTYYSGPFVNERYTSKKNKTIYKTNSEVLKLHEPYNYRTFTDLDWKISPEKKIINGYTCYKAIGKVKYFIDKYSYYVEAWFCPEIPLPYGPDIYAGLPGLVFEAYRKDSKELHWTLKAIEKNKTKTFKIPEITNALHYEVYDKIYYDAIQKIMKM